MTEPTLVPKQLSSAENIAKLSWTTIPGTYDIMSYALFECDEVFSAWKTWADASGSADQKAWDGSKYIIAINYEPSKTTQSEFEKNNNNGLCLWTKAGGVKDNPGYCVFINDNDVWSTWKAENTKVASGGIHAG